MNKQIQELKVGIAEARSTLANMRKDLQQLEKNVAWKNLSNHEIAKIWNACDGKLIYFARGIEQALREKNHGQTI